MRKMDNGETSWLFVVFFQKYDRRIIPIRSKLGTAQRVSMATDYRQKLELQKGSRLTFPARRICDHIYEQIVEYMSSVGREYREAVLPDGA